MIITREYIENLIKANARIRIANEIIYDEDLSGLNLNNITFLNTKFINVSFINTNMGKNLLENIEFKKCDLTNANLRNALAENITFRKCTLNNTNLTNANLHHTKFYDMKFEKANFNEAELTYAFFENCICEDLKCIETSFQYAKLINCTFKNCDFDKASLAYSKLKGVTGENLKCIKMYCPSLRVDECKFSNTNFKLSIIADGDIRNSNFNNVCFKSDILPKYINSEYNKSKPSNTALENTLFEDILFVDTNFENANCSNNTMHNCNFISCNCKNTNFQNSKMDNVCFNKSDLENANFMNNKITELTLEKTITDNIDFTDISLNSKEDLNTDFQFTTGSNTRFETADITNANFEYSKLKATNFKNTNLTGIKLGSKHFEQIWDKDDISETIDIAGCINKDDTLVQPETSNKANSQSPITALQTDIEKLMEDIINDLKSARENDDETLLKAYSKQITKMKNIINRIKNDDKLPDDVKEATLDFISDIAAIFEYRKIGLATKLSIELTLKTGPRKPHDCTDKIKPNNVFTDEYYGFYISKFNAEHMVKAYKIIHGTNKTEDWSVADIMVNCLDIQEVNFAAYNEIFIDFINDLERFECDGFIIQVTKDKAEKINEDELIATCKTHYGFYLPTDFDYKNNIVLFRGRYSV